MGLYPRRDLPLLRPCPAASTSCRQSPSGSNVPAASEQGTRHWGGRRLALGAGRGSPTAHGALPGRSAAVLFSSTRGLCEESTVRSAGQPGATKAQGLAWDYLVQGARVSV